MHEVDDGGVEEGRVEADDGPSAHVVACVGAVGFVDEQRDGGVEEDPDVEGPLRHVWHFFILCVHWDLLVEFEGVHVQGLDQPVADVPLISGRGAPSGLH